MANSQQPKHKPDNKIITWQKVATASNIHLQGKLGRLRGHQNECRLFSAVKNRQAIWPRWMLGIRRATREEDGKGIDIVVYVLGVGGVRDGKIGVQVKSSIRAAQRFRAEHRHDEKPIPVIIVGDKDRESTLFLKFIDRIKAHIKEMADG